MTKQTQRIGWIGTGVMGNSMCHHLLNNGYQSLTVYNRTPQKAESLLEAGAQWAESPAAVAANANWLFTIVSLPGDVASTYLGPDGVLAHLQPGSIAVDMTTSSPQLAIRIATEAKKKGIAVIDAPVSGGDVGAREGRLSIMAGGDEGPFQTVLPALETFGRNIQLMGPAGSGQHTKVSNQIHISGTMISMLESLLYAERAGLDLEEVIALVGQGAAGSWSINNLGPRIAQGNFQPGFFIDHFVKDMGIALEEARRMHLSLPGLALAQQFYIAAQAQGLGKMGTHALMQILRRMNGMGDAAE